MAWPTLQDYNEAIQAPRLNFGDPELKGGTVETNALGLPRPITGAFATVYQLRCGNRDWAVRCFQRDFTDQQLRYEAISKHLLAANLPYMVRFDFETQGIRVAGKWYPILKMEWVKGELLHQYIKRNLKNSGALLSLAARWAAMLKALQAANIAHGDLQHGNVLIVNGEIRLLDYDGMYVPALAGKSSHEVGHRNYQHPQRTEFDFGPNVDNFSAWVIYVSLLVLSIDPGLWDRARAGDECLLFRQQDFEEPYSSEILVQLSKHSDQRLYTLFSFFQSLLYNSPAQLPTLDGQPALQILSVSPEVTASGSAKGLPSWLRGHVPDTPPAMSPSQVGTAEPSTWVLDFISPAASIEQKLLEPDALKPQILILVGALTCGLLLVLYFATILSIATIVGLICTAVISAAGLLRSLYRTNSVVITMLEVNRREKGERYNLDASQKEIKGIEAKKFDIRKKEEKDFKVIQAELAAMQARERTKKGQAQARLTSALKPLNARRQLISRTEAKALRKTKDRTGAVVTRLNSQIAALTAGEQYELTKTLRNLQEQAVRAHLIASSVEHGAIQGVGVKLKARLQYAGIRTAADVEYWKVSQVDGIGSSKASALVAWRDHIAAYAPVPRALSLSQVAAIQAKNHSQKQQLQVQLGVSQQRLNTEENEIRALAESEMKVVNDKQLATQNKTNEELRTISDGYVALYLRLTQRRSSISSEANTQCETLDEAIRQVRKRMGEKHWKLAKTRHELLSYKNVSFRFYLRRVLGLSAS